MLSAQNSVLWKHNHRETASGTFCVTSQYVTTELFLQRIEEMKVAWCQDPTQPNTWQPCGGNLDGSVSNIHCTLYILDMAPRDIPFRSSGEAESNTPQPIIHNSPPPIPIQIQIHSDHITILKINFHVILPPTSGVARFVTPKNSNHNDNPRQ